MDKVISGHSIIIDASKMHDCEKNPCTWKQAMNRRLSKPVVSDTKHETGTVRNAYCPEPVLADKIYRTRKNLQCYAEYCITLNRPKLGRPPKERRLYDAQKRLERQEAGERNAIEGKFGEAKRRYGLNRVMTRLSGTSASVIHLITIVMNLKKSLRDRLLTFFQLWQQDLIWRLQPKYAFEQ